MMTKNSEKKNLHSNDYSLQRMTPEQERELLRAQGLERVRAQQDQRMVQVRERQEQGLEHRVRELGLERVQRLRVLEQGLRERVREQAHQGHHHWEVQRIGRSWIHSYTK